MADAAELHANAAPVPAKRRKNFRRQAYVELKPCMVVDPNIWKMQNMTAKRLRLY